MYEQTGRESPGTGIVGGEVQDTHGTIMCEMLNYGTLCVAPMFIRLARVNQTPEPPNGQDRSHGIAIRFPSSQAYAYVRRRIRDGKSASARRPQ